MCPYSHKWRYLSLHRKGHGLAEIKSAVLYRQRHTLFGGRYWDSDNGSTFIDFSSLLIRRMSDMNQHLQ